MNPDEPSPDSKNLEALVTEFDVTELADNPARREAIKTADIVIGVDKRTGYPTAFFGRAILQEVVNGRAAEFTAQRMARVHYDSGTDSLELEYLCAAVQVLKGRHEYQC